MEYYKNAHIVVRSGKYAQPIICKTIRKHIHSIESDFRINLFERISAQDLKKVEFFSEGYTTNAKIEYLDGDIHFATISTEGGE